MKKTIGQPMITSNTDSTPHRNSTFGSWRVTALELYG
jgi:hypothetical protein